jgi:hypothetical protein
MPLEKEEEKHMKTGKIVFLLLMTVSLVMSGALGAQAAQTWYLDYYIDSAGVYTAGVTTSRVAISLLHTEAEPPIDCWATATREKEMLTNALAAFANNKTVDVLVDTTLVDGRVTILDLLVKP